MSLYKLVPDVVYMDTLEDRIREMVAAVLIHRDVIMTYEFGAVVLNFKGKKISPQLDRVALNTDYKKDILTT